MYSNSEFILKYKLPKIVNSWLILLKIMTILFIIFMFIPYNTYQNHIGYVEIKNNNSYILLEKNTPLNKNLYINGKKYEYKIVDNKDYIKIKLELEDSLKIDSLYLNVNIRSDRKTLFKVLKNKIKKGIGL